MMGAAVNAATGRAVMSWFPASERGLALGIRQTAVPVGGGLGAIVLPALEGAFGLGAAFLALALACAAAAVAAFTWLREAPGFPEETIAGRIGSPLRDRRLWQLAAGSTLLVSVQIALTGFVVLFLHEERGLSPGKAGGPGGDQRRRRGPPHRPRPVRPDRQPAPSASTLERGPRDRDGGGGLLTQAPDPWS